jgi:hypothetical protein
MSLPEDFGYEHLLLYFLLSRGMNFRSREYEPNPESLYLFGKVHFYTRYRLTYVSIITNVLYSKSIIW